MTLRAARRSVRFFAAKEPDMKRELIDEAVRAATRIAADRGIDLDQTALIPAVLAVIGTSNGQDDPEEIAEDALELMGKGLGPPASRRGRRPFSSCCGSQLEIIQQAASSRRRAWHALPSRQHLPRAHDSPKRTAWPDRQTYRPCAQQRPPVQCSAHSSTFRRERSCRPSWQSRVASRGP